MLSVNGPFDLLKSMVNCCCRWAQMLPASVQVCPVEIPGRGRREGEPAVNNVPELARQLAHGLPLSDKPYIIFGTCLGAIIGYEIVREVEQSQCAAMPVAFMPAAASPPHLYAKAVMKIYLRRRLGERPSLLEHALSAAFGFAVRKRNVVAPHVADRVLVPVSAGRNETPPVQDVLRILHGWRDLPKGKLLQAFEGGHFAGIEEMKRSDRVFERVAPMGVNDIMMAVQYRCCSPDAERKLPRYCLILDYAHATRSM